MSAIGQLWFKWVIDPHKPATIEDVPNLWRAEVEQLVRGHKQKEKEKTNDENFE